MKKKFVVAVAAVVMAAVMSVSAFAADDVKVPSITGDATGPASEIFVPQSNAEASATANAAYNTLASTEGSVVSGQQRQLGGHYRSRCEWPRHLQRALPHHCRHPVYLKRTPEQHSGQEGAFISGPKRL